MRSKSNDLQGCKKFFRFLNRMNVVEYEFKELRK